MMTQLIRQARGVCAILRTRLFAIFLLFATVTFIVFQFCARTHAVVCTTDMTQRSLYFVLEKNAAGAVERFQSTNASLEAQTLAEPDRYIQLTAPTEVHATIRVDGQTISCEAENGTTVGELLHREGVVYDGNDILMPSAEKPLESGEQIVLQRVDFTEHVEEEIIPYETIRKNSTLLRAGQTKVLQEGVTGKIARSYTRCMVDGKQDELQFLSEKTIRNPVDEIILVGANTPISPVDFGFEVDSNGKPLHYKRLLTDQVATGYSARPGALTASGRKAVVGTVAVNPNIIPYGSKLYIASSDGKFVYGCAVAADTGTGLMQGIIDVDLFYETYRESALNGRKIVDIYVLE